MQRRTSQPRHRKSAACSPRPESNSFCPRPEPVAGIMLGLREARFVCPVPCSVTEATKVLDTAMQSRCARSLKLSHTVQRCDWPCTEGTSTNRGKHSYMSAPFCRNFFFFFPFTGGRKTFGERDIRSYGSFRVIFCQIHLRWLTLSLQESLKKK